MNLKIIGISLGLYNVSRLLKAGVVSLLLCFFFFFWFLISGIVQVIMKQIALKNNAEIGLKSS